MISFLKIVFLIGLGFFAGQTYSPTAAEAGVVDRVVLELQGIAEAVDRVGEKLECVKP
jgi:hypothetical protein